MTEASLDTLEGRPDLVRQAEEDKALASAVAQNASAFVELYHRHVNHVYHYILARVGHVQDAQDLTSQTFLAALDSISSYRGQGSFAAWLIGIARRKVIDHFRRSHSTVSLDAVAQVPSHDVLPDEVVGWKISLEQVTQALHSLSPDRAEVFTLRILAGLSTSEVASLTGKSETAVRMLVHRALRDVRKQFSGATEDE